MKIIYIIVKFAKVQPDKNLLLHFTTQVYYTVSVQDLGKPHCRATYSGDYGLSKLGKKFHKAL